MIKIIAVLDNQIGAGGGFDQALNAIIQMQRLSANRFVFEVLTTDKSNFQILGKIGVDAKFFKLSFIDSLMAKLSQNNIWIALQNRLKIISPLESRVIKEGGDIIYFLTPGNLSAGMQKVNYICTLWDLCHRESPEFPEVRDFNIFSQREKNFSHNIAPAIFTITDSNRLSDLAANYYGIDRNRFIAMPFAHTPFLEQKISESKEKVLEKYGLRGDYFYYPAQFWAHKNHIRILQALKLLREFHNWRPQVVFSGKDHGNLDHILEYINVHRLEAQVRILGFVPSADLLGLYENSKAIVMPTYFGPTNLPPLEAWKIGKPLIYSKNCSEQAGNAALLIDPDNEQELAEAMLLCLDPEICKKQVNAGYVRLKEISIERQNAEEEFCTMISKFSVRRQCWA